MSVFAANASQNRCVAPAFSDRNFMAGIPVCFFGLCRQLAFSRNGMAESVSRVLRRRNRETIRAENTSYNAVDSGGPLIVQRIQRGRHARTHPPNTRPS